MNSVQRDILMTVLYHEVFDDALDEDGLYRFRRDRSLDRASFLGNLSQLEGVYLTNTTYAYFSMLNGDAFAKQFGGASGDDPDWFLLSILAFDAGGAETGSLDFYLADFRSADNDLDYILDAWTYLDLSALGPVKSLRFGP